MKHVLDNPAFNALQSGNKNLAFGSAQVKYFDKDVAPFVGLEENTPENFQKLYQELPRTGPAIIISTVELEIPGNWKLLRTMHGRQMIYNGGIIPTDTQPALVTLTDEHIPQMLALTKLTNPGPFFKRTIEFGHYKGFFDGDKLVAMAGQRMQPFPYAEISAVCTHPDYLGRRYAKQLLHYHINRIITEGNVPCLHVRFDNERAIGVYHDMGFEARTEIYFYVLQKVST